MSDADKKPLLSLLTGVLTEHLREFGEQAKSELQDGLSELRDELGARHFDERFREFAQEAKSQLQTGIDQFRQELEAELEEVRSRRRPGSRSSSAASEPPATGSVPQSDGAEAETVPQPRVRVLDDPPGGSGS